MRGARTHPTNYCHRIYNSYRRPNTGRETTVNLATNALNMHVTAVMSKDFSQKVGGNNIGGLLQTALANNKGELVMPVIVTGTFGSPHFAPDAQEIGRMKLQNLVPSFGNPGDMTSGILGAVVGGNKKGGQQQQQGGLGGILGTLGGQQKTNPQKPQQQPAAADSRKQNPQHAQPEEPLGDLLKPVMQGKRKKQQQPPPSPPPQSA